MEGAKVNWFVKEPDNVYTAHDEYYAGTCSPDSDFLLETELWNNKWNSTDVADMKNAKLIISFASAEDSVLLSLCTVSVDGEEFTKPDTNEFNRATVNLGTISGDKNNGSSNYKDNYRRIAIKFSNIPTNFKDGLKSMFLDVQYDE